MAERARPAAAPRAVARSTSREPPKRGHSTSARPQAHSKNPDGRPTNAPSAATSAMPALSGSVTNSDPMTSSTAYQPTSVGASSALRARDEATRTTANATAMKTNVSRRSMRSIGAPATSTARLLPK